MLPLNHKAPLPPIKAYIYDFLVIFGSIITIMTSNVAVSVQILRNHFRGDRGGQGNDYLDYLGGVQDWAKVDYVICARSLISLFFTYKDTFETQLFFHYGFTIKLGGGLNYQ